MTDQIPRHEYVPPGTRIACGFCLAVKEIVNDGKFIIFRGMCSTICQDCIAKCLKVMSGLQFESEPPGKPQGWIRGNGSQLPIGTEAWVAWKARDGYGVTWSYRRDGGWGSDGVERDSLEGPAYPDEPGMFGMTPVVFYRLDPKPAPPDDEVK